MVLGNNGSVFFAGMKKACSKRRHALHKVSPIVGTQLFRYTEKRDTKCRIVSALPKWFSCVPCSAYHKSAENARCAAEKTANKLQLWQEDWQSSAAMIYCLCTDRAGVFFRRGARGCPKAYAVCMRMRRFIRRLKNLRICELTIHILWFRGFDSHTGEISRWPEWLTEMLAKHSHSDYVHMGVIPKRVISPTDLLKKFY